MKVSQRNWAEVFGEGNMFAISPVSTFQKVNIILFHLLLRNVLKKVFCIVKITVYTEELKQFIKNEKYSV